MFIIALKLLKGEDFAAILRVLDLSTLSSIAPGDALIEEESHDLSLVNVAMVWIDLDKRLNLSDGLLGKASAIDTLEHLNKLVTINYAFVYLLIILLQLGEHLVHLFFH